MPNPPKFLYGEREPFPWPERVQQSIRSRIDDAISRLKPARFAQEPAYVAALIGRLDGVYFEEAGCRVEILGTIANDRGPNAAEKKYGADFALTAALQYGTRVITKVVLGQAKRGAEKNLPLQEKLRLHGQIIKMKQQSDCCIVLETPTEAGDSPGVRVIDASAPRFKSFQDYLIGGLLSCQHGDTRDLFVSRVQSSRLDHLHIEIKHPKVS